MTNPLLPALFNLRAHRGARRRVFIAIDAAAAIDPPEVFRCLRPWLSWVEVTGVIRGDAPAIVRALNAFAAEGADVVMLISHDVTLGSAIGHLAARGGAIGVDSRIPPDGSRDLALFQEVLHHDFSLGGWNEWRGEDSLFGPAVLRSLSTAHSHMGYPRYMEPHLEARRAATGGEPLLALDVGCGSISRLRWGALTGRLTITGIDPLLDMYAVVRERHGLSALPEVRCAREICGGAEDLGDRLPAGSFDFAYCANALDHTEDPVAVVETIAAMLKPGGLFAVEAYTREGSRENWWQLHQFDMYIDGQSRFVCETRAGEVRAIFSDRCGLTVREVVASNDTRTIVVAARA